MRRSIAIAAAGLAILADTVAVPTAAQAATPYEAICIVATSSGAASKDWHGKNPQDCKGEYRLYKLNSNSASLMVEVLPKVRVSFYQAAKKSEKQLNDWCSSHSFNCAASVGAFFSILNPLLSTARS